MRRSLLAGAALALLAGPASAAFVPYEITGRVVKVLSGDTIEVAFGSKSQHFYLENIDCPELAQDSGEAARRFTADKVNGKQVRLAVNCEDQRGALMGRVFLPDGEELNAALVERGLAWWSGLASQEAESELAALESEAKAEQRGLWGQSNPYPPWSWGDGHSLRRCATAEQGVAFEPVLTAPPPPTPAPRPEPKVSRNCIPRSQCCRVCTKGRACGNSCISARYTCRKGRGCACNSWEICR